MVSLPPKYGFVLAIFLLALVAICDILPTATAMAETDRVAEYDKRYPREWPPKDYLPNLEGWKNIHERRFNQIRELEVEDGKYEGYVSKG